MKQKIGIKKIAELSGVSIGTVDRVLNNRKGVSKSTAEHIRAVIRKTGYKKNNVASRLKLAQNKSIGISVLFPKEAHLKEHYWNLPLKGIGKAVKELNEMGITHELHVFDVGSRKSFKKESEKILRNKPSALITVPFFSKQCVELSEKAEELNIPIVFVDTQKNKELISPYSIYQNSFQSGKVAARILSQIIGNQGKYIVLNLINNKHSQQNNKERESGFRVYFESECILPKSPEIHSITINQSNLNSLKEVFAPFAKDKNPIGIFVTNSRTYLLPKVLDEIGITNSTLIGYDLNPANINLLKQNKIQFIINQQPEYQGYHAVRGIFKLLTENDDSELDQKIPIEIIVKENLN